MPATQFQAYLSQLNFDQSTGVFEGQCLLIILKRLGLPFVVYQRVAA